MNNLEWIPFPLVASMIVGELLIVPMLGWWPLIGVTAAIVSAVWFVQKL
jgi:hypothetical protein